MNVHPLSLTDPGNCSGNWLTLATDHQTDWLSKSNSNCTDHQPNWFWGAGEVRVLYLLLSPLWPWLQTWLILIPTPQSDSDHQPDWPWQLILAKWVCSTSLPPTWRTLATPKTTNLTTSDWLRGGEEVSVQHLPTPQSDWPPAWLATDHQTDWPMGGECAAPSYPSQSPSLTLTTSLTHPGNSYRGSKVAGAWLTDASLESARHSIENPASPLLLQFFFSIFRAWRHVVGDQDCQIRLF